MIHLENDESRRAKCSRKPTSGAMSHLHTPQSPPDVDQDAEVGEWAMSLHDNDGPRVLNGRDFETRPNPVRHHDALLKNKQARC